MYGLVFPYSYGHTAEGGDDFEDLFFSCCSLNLDWLSERERVSGRGKLTRVPVGTSSLPDGLLFNQSSVAAETSTVSPSRIV